MSIFSKVRKGFVNAFVSPSAKAAGEIGSNKGAVDFFLAGGLLLYLHAFLDLEVWLDLYLEKQVVVEQ